METRVFFEMCAEGFVLVADNVTPPCLDNTTGDCDERDDGSLYFDSGRVTPSKSTTEKSFLDRTGRA